MRTFELNKLVRDEVFHDMQVRGQEPVYQIVEDNVEFKHLLLEKLAEETEEKDEIGADIVEEDRQIEAVRKQLAILDGIEEMSILQRNQVGAFAGRYFVKTVTLADDDPWQDYYLKRPERFPEQT